MNIDDLLTQARQTWQRRGPMTIDEIAVVMGVVYGDICRQARAIQEGKPIDEQELKKELGNIIYSAIRWCDDLGYDPKECIALAQDAQSNYMARYRSRY